MSRGDSVDDRYAPDLFESGGGPTCRRFAAPFARPAASVSMRIRRGTRQRLDAVAARLGDGAQGSGGLDQVVTRLEVAAEHLHSELESERAERQRLFITLQALSEGVLIVDEYGELVFRNAVAEQFVGARHSDALAEQAVRELISAALRGTPGERELRLFGPPRRRLRCRSLPLEDDVRTLGAAILITDVAEAHRVDELRRDFVANVSHELRTPIGALGLLADTLAAEENVAVASRLADRMAEEASRLGRIVEDLLDLSAIEIDEERRHELVSLDELVREAVGEVVPIAERAGIAITVRPFREATYLPCDRWQVVSALRNLLDNAVKYSLAPSTVEVEVEVDESAEKVIVVVRDHGIGIPARDLERIFERFYRVDRARSRATGGTGLGLAIVRHVAEGHGGRVAVESTEGVGSSFRLELSSAESPLAKVSP